MMAPSTTALAPRSIGYGTGWPGSAAAAPRMRTSGFASVGSSKAVVAGLPAAGAAEIEIAA